MFKIWVREKQQDRWQVIDGGWPVLVQTEQRQRGLQSLSPGGRLCLGMTPEGAGFTLLAREDKHSLHMLRVDDKGIALLNEGGGRGGVGV